MAYGADWIESKRDKSNKGQELKKDKKKESKIKKRRQNLLKQTKYLEIIY